MTNITKTLKFNNKKSHNKQITLAIVSVICLVINYLLVLYSKNNESFVEMNYSRGFYKSYSHFLTLLNRAIPFSVSEVLYLLMILICVVLLLYSLKLLFSQQFNKALTNLLVVILIICGNVLYFQVSWGLNNYRSDVETLFELNNEEIDVDDLAKSYEFLVLQSNKYKSLSDKEPQPSVKEIMVNTYKGYENLSLDYSFIDGFKSAVKPLLISPLFSFSGYTGIYLPLISEANINDMPYISSIGFTASHELAHQKGFASEDEANFIGFMANINQEDSYYKYSGYQAMMIYIGNSLYKNDQDLYTEISLLRSDLVIADLKAKNLFWDEHIKEKTNEVHNQVNDVFLKANNQPDGIVNYSKVTELFVKAYRQGIIEDL